MKIDRLKLIIEKRFLRPRRGKNGTKEFRSFLDIYGILRITLITNRSQDKAFTEVYKPYASCGARHIQLVYAE